MSTFPTVNRFNVWFEIPIVQRLRIFTMPHGRVAITAHRATAIRAHVMSLNLYLEGLQLSDIVLDHKLQYPAANSHAQGVRCQAYHNAK